MFFFSESFVNSYAYYTGILLLSVIFSLSFAVSGSGIFSDKIRSCQLQKMGKHFGVQCSTILIIAVMLISLWCFNYAALSDPHSL